MFLHNYPIVLVLTKATDTNQYGLQCETKAGDTWIVLDALEYHYYQNL